VRLQEGEAILTWAKKPGALAGLELEWDSLGLNPLSNAGAGFWFQPRHDIFQLPPAFAAVVLRAVSAFARLAATFYNVAVTP
jgi:hypothetical protein